MSAEQHAEQGIAEGDVNVALSVWSNTCNAYCSEEDRTHAPECLLAAGLYNNLALLASPEFARCIADAKAEVVRAVERDLDDADQGTDSMERPNRIAVCALWEDAVTNGEPWALTEDAPSGCVHGIQDGCFSRRCGSNCYSEFDRMHPCPACALTEDARGESDV